MFSSMNIVGSGYVLLILSFFFPVLLIALVHPIAIPIVSFTIGIPLCTCMINYLSYQDYVSDVLSKKYELTIPKQIPIIISKQLPEMQDPNWSKRPSH
jgi:hypothetical protein